MNPVSPILIRLAVVFCLGGLLAPQASGFSSDGSALTRSFAGTISLTNQPLVVTVTFTNSGATALRGFFYTDQVPSGLAVTTLGVKVNGTALNDYTFETGTADSVYAGCTPRRWVLEAPPSFAAANPIPAPGTLQITYAVNSATPGVFPLQHFSWAGYRGNITNTSFGCSENGDQQSLKFTNRVFAPLAVLVAGRGTVTPNYHGQLLEVGKRYTMTATPAAGFSFTNWTGSLTTNHPVLSFWMQSNLTFTANFTDITRPTVLITNPLAHARLTNTVVTFRGTAGDNLALDRVEYQLNNGPFQTATGTSNWAATVNLPAGTNVFRVRSFDTADNESLPVSRSVYFVVLKPLTLLTNGAGTVTVFPAARSNLLEVGRSYALTATPFPGFGFGTWDGGLVSSNRLLNFVMSSNLMLRANFRDITRPTSFITSPLVNTRLTNALAEVKGSARDNVGVAHVFYQLNGGGWTNANTINLWTNWSAAVALRAGTNLVRAYAQDQAGNCSLTNSVSVQYVVPHPVNLQLVGKGTVIGLTNQQRLELGRAYQFNTLAAPGFVLTNWTTSADGGTIQSTNRPPIRFLMASNLTLAVTFADVQKPLLTVTTPLTGARITNELARVRGRVTDNGWVETVTCRLNSGNGWTALGTTNWETDLTLQPGTNWFEVFATDREGLRSATNRAAYFRVVTNVLTVTKNGHGTVAPDYHGQWLEIGRRYTMTATPALRHLFATWSGDLASTNPVLSFLMQSNLTLSANFVTNPFVGLKGTYYGLFAPTNAPRRHDGSGSFILTLAESGIYSASFRLGTALLPTTGKFDWLGRSGLNLKPSLTNTVTVALQLDVTNLTAWVQGGVSNGNWFADLAGYRAPVYLATNASPQLGRYTLALPGSDDAAARPGGDSYGTVIVSRAGWLTLAGRLADGTTLNQSIPVSPEGCWALYAPLYLGKGSVLAWLTFTNLDTSDINGRVSWIKPAIPAAKYYPLGFTNEGEALGSRYVAPGTTNRVLNLTNGVVVFSGGNLPQPFTNNILLTTNHKVTNLSSNGLTMNLTLTSGLLNGSVTDPNTRKGVLFNGALLQKINAAYGYFLGTNQSGQVLLEPAP